MNPLCGRSLHLATEKPLAIVKKLWTGELPCGRLRKTQNEFLSRWAITSRFNNLDNVKANPSRQPTQPTDYFEKSLRIIDKPVMQCSPRENSSAQAWMTTSLPRSVGTFFRLPPRLLDACIPGVEAVGRQRDRLFAQNRRGLRSRESSERGRPGAGPGRARYDCPSTKGGASAPFLRRQTDHCALVPHPIHKRPQLSRPRRMP